MGIGLCGLLPRKSPFSSDGISCFSIYSNVSPALLPTSGRLLTAGSAHGISSSSQSTIGTAAMTKGMPAEAICSTSPSSAACCKALTTCTKSVSAPLGFKQHARASRNGLYMLVYRHGNPLYKGCKGTIFFCSVEEKNFRHLKSMSYSTAEFKLLVSDKNKNFPLKYFYGESVNAIESQIWVCLIANLLLTVVNRKVKRRWAFSNLVTAVRQMLMYYVDIFSFLENPERTWERINAERCETDTGQLVLQF